MRGLDGGARIGRVEIGDIGDGFAGRGIGDGETRLERARPRAVHIGVGVQERFVVSFSMGVF